MGHKGTKEEHNEDCCAKLEITSSGVILGKTATFLEMTESLF